MEKITKFVTKKPKLVILIAVLLLIPTAFSYLFTSVNYDILTYLPGNRDSVKGEEILSDTYNISSATMVIVENMQAKNVLKLKNKISEVKDVSSVLWADDVIDVSVPASILPDKIKSIFYSDDENYTMMFVFFSRDCSSKDKIDAVNEIKKVTANQCLVSGMSAISADTREISNRQLPIYISLAVILALAVMLITMNNVKMPFLLVGVLCMAVVYNMGTNLILGGVSYITQCIAAILQLGVTMDYSIFLVNRYEEERNRWSTKEEAMTKALSGSGMSLMGSSMTTLFGFLALCFMQLKLGFNIGIVMAKGVLLGLASAVIILPAFILVFEDKIYGRKHKQFSPDFGKLVKFNVKHNKLFTRIFIILFIPVLLLAANGKKYYNLTSTLPDDLGSVQALDTLEKEFNMTTSHYIVVKDDIPVKNLVKMETRLQQVEGIDSLIAYNAFLGTSIPDTIIPDGLINLIKQGGYQIMLANSRYEASTDESNAQVEEMNKIVKDYGEENYVTGEGALYNDLIEITKVDFTVTSIISIIAIYILIAIVFKSWSIPILLIASIEFAILLNEGISTLMGVQVPFIAPTIISCVQLGATVDYAILLTSRFKEEIAKGVDKKKAIKRAAKVSMRSVFQSSMIFFFATIGVYFVSSLEVVREICAMLARGSLISAAVILFFLIPVLYRCEGFIAKTSRDWGVNTAEQGTNPNTYEFNTDETEISFTEFTFDDDSQGKDDSNEKI